MTDLQSKKIRAAPSSKSSDSVKSTDCQYPFAAAPDIIRSNQKDIYIQGLLFENVSTILRNIYGARFLHKYAPEARTFADALYLGCTTLVGNRTLGEEYCDIVQIESDTRKLPHIARRAGYILTSVLLPYVLERTLPRLRARFRLRLELNLAKQDEGRPTFSRRLQAYLLENLPSLTSPAPLYALGLSIFYFTGAYYHISKRLSGLRYIFTKRIDPSDQRIGYEVLGVLLVLQMTVQSWLHVRTVLERGPTVETGDEQVESKTNIGKTVETKTHTPVSLEPRYALEDQGLLGWIEGPQQRKCTLCLEELKDPSATTCGHVFCWTCIADWVKEKAECPLCRQAVMSQHILPLRG